MCACNVFKHNKVYFKVRTTTETEGLLRGPTPSSIFLRLAWFCCVLVLDTIQFHLVFW